MGDEDWDLLIAISRGLERASTEIMSAEKLISSIRISSGEESDEDTGPIISDSTDTAAYLTDYVFARVMDELVAIYESMDESRRELFEQLIDSLGPSGVEILFRVLAGSENKEIRKLSL